MANYIEKNLAKDEVIIVKADKNKLALIGIWIKPVIWTLAFIVIITILSETSIKFDMEGIMGKLFWLLIISPLLVIINAIKKTVVFLMQETAITNRRIFGKKGFLSTEAIDASLEQVQSCFVKQPLFGKIFNYSTFMAQTGRYEAITVNYIKNAEQFRVQVNNQLEALKKKRAEEQAKIQAKQLAMAVAMANKSGTANPPAEQ